MLNIFIVVFFLFLSKFFCTRFKVIRLILQVIYISYLESYLLMSFYFSSYLKSIQSWTNILLILKNKF